MRTSRFQNFLNSLKTANNVGTLFSDEKFQARIRNEMSGSAATNGLKGQIRNESTDCVEILFHDYIGDYWTGSDSATIAKLFADNRGKKIKCDINSFGGSAYDGIAIYNAMCAHDAEIEIVISGIAYSAASIIAMGGDKIKIAANGTLGIHPASIGLYGNQYDMEHYANWLKSIDLGIIDTYAARTGKSVKQVTEWFIGKNNDGSFFNGKEAVEYGFADELMPLKKKTDEDTEDDDSQDTENSGSRFVPESVKSRIAAIQNQMADDEAKKRRARLQQILKH